MNLGTAQEEVLREAVVTQQRAYVNLDMALKHYNSKQSAKSGMEGLEEKGILERVNNGYWRITNLPEYLYSEFGL